MGGSGTGGYAVLADVEFLEKLLKKNFTGMYVFQHDIPLVVVDDFSIENAGILPYKTKTPLIIDSNAVLTTPFTTDLFQAV